MKTRRKPIALEFVVEPRVERIHVDRQPPFAPEVVPDVLVSRPHMAAVHAELRGQRADETLGVGAVRAVGMLLVGEERRVVQTGSPSARQ